VKGGENQMIRIKKHRRKLGTKHSCNVRGHLKRGRRK